jgi:hypothetical protein
MPSSPTQSSQPSPTEPSITSTGSSSEESHDILSHLQELQNEGIYYAAVNDICSLCEFVYNKDIKGDMLVPQDDKMKMKTSEFILSKIFAIDARNFFMT